jgi:thiol:disulfide interchange protein DsbG
MLKHVFLAALLSALPIGALAATPAPTAASANQPAALKYLIKKGLKVDSRFSAPGKLTGYIGTVPGGKHTVFFIPKDGSVAIFGAMVDAYGHNLSRAYLSHYQRGPGAASAYKNLKTKRWIAEGARHPKRIVYAFIDPNCPYCWQLWKQARAYYDKGLQMRYIMVAIFGKDSVRKAAAILNAKDPRRALDRNESGFKHHSGAIKPLTKVSKQLRSQIVENTALMGHFGFNGTPAMVWKDDNSAVKTSEGLPQGQTLAQTFKLVDAEAP